MRQGNRISRLRRLKGQMEGGGPKRGDAGKPGRMKGENKKQKRVVSHVPSVSSLSESCGTKLDGNVQLLFHFVLARVFGNHKLVKASVCIWKSITRNVS